MHLTKKDFEVQWFSGSGAGGQHRNKHQNCCRIIHKETGLRSNGTASRERISNQREAFKSLAKKIIFHYQTKEIRDVNKSVIRNYNESRNEVHDKASGLKMPYAKAMNNIGPMIEARRDAKNG